MKTRYNCTYFDNMILNCLEVFNNGKEFRYLDAFKGNHLSDKHKIILYLWKTINYQHIRADIEIDKEYGSIYSILSKALRFYPNKDSQPPNLNKFLDKFTILTDEERQYLKLLLR